MLIIIYISNGMTIMALVAVTMTMMIMPGGRWW
jgi:hypothetical protein